MGIARVVLWQLRQRERQAQRGEAIAPAPGRIGQRLVAIESVGPQHQLLHEAQVPVGHIKVAALTRQRTGLSHDGRAHEHRVAVLVVIGHGFAHLPRCVEAQIGHLANCSNVARVTGATGQLGEHNVARHHQRIGAREAVFAAIYIGLNEATHIIHVAQTGAGDQRDGIDVEGLIEVMAIVHGQGISQLTGRAGAAAIEFGMGIGPGDGAQFGHPVGGRA